MAAWARKLLGIAAFAALGMSAGAARADDLADAARIAREPLAAARHATSAADGRKLMEEGATRLFELFRKAPGPCRPDDGSPRPEACAHIGLEAGLAYGASGHPAKSIAVFRAVVGFEREDSRSADVRYALLAAADAYRTIGVFDYAADWYDRYLSGSVGGPSERASAIERALPLWIAIEQFDVARNHVHRFDGQYGNQQPARAATLWMLLANALVDGGNYWMTKRVLMESRARWGDAAAPFDVAVRCGVLLARASAETTEPDRAREEYAVVVKRWEQADATARASRLGLEAAGEAAFALVEMERERVTAVPAPRYEGPLDAAAFTAFATTKLRNWYVDRRVALTALEHEYVKIATPAAHPRWIVAAAASVGLMWADFADDIRAVASTPAPLPKDAFDQLMALRASIVDERTRGTLLQCVQLATKLQVVGEAPARCEAWLAKNYPAQFHRATDLGPRLLMVSGDRAVAPLAAP